MKRAIIVWIYGLLAPLSLWSTHIAGGDFTVRHISGNTFEAKLVLYRDCAGNPLAFDPVISITVYDAVTNELRSDLAFTISNPTDGNIALGNSCYDPNLCIESQTYIQQITLPDNPNGYYMSWERCCRNDIAQNIATALAGMVFTVQVADPALQNSTPEFVPYPAEAFLCINGINDISFQAIDADGDSLVYSFGESLRGSATSQFNPTSVLAGPRPYAIVNWIPPYTVLDQVGSVPPIAIDQTTGMVTAIPAVQGFYSLCVVVEEYRNGVKIGEIRREIQVAGLICDFDLPSEIFTPNDDTIFNVFANTQWCIELTTTDPNEDDALFFEALGELMDGTVTPSASFPPVSGTGSITQDFCWAPRCEHVRDEPYIVVLQSFSEGCAPESFITTKTIYIYVVLDVNQPTTLIEPSTLNSIDPAAIIDLYNPGTHCFSFVFEDPNVADSLYITASSKIFELPNAQELDFEFGQGTVTLPYCWFVQCSDVRDEPYFVDFEVITVNCNVQDTTFFSVPISVIVPNNEPTTFTQPAQEISFEFYTGGDSLCFPVSLFDINFFDTLIVSGSGIPFEMLGNPAVFEPDTGVVQLDGVFCWVPKCADVRPEPYRVTFMATANSCKTADTVYYPVDIFLTLPPESAPYFEFPDPGTFIEYTLGSSDPAELNFLVLARDDQPYDTLTLTMSTPALDAPGNKPFFEPFTNTLIVASDFIWEPLCADVSEDPYPVTFIVTSRSCQKVVSTELQIEILVNTPTRGNIEPIPNVFTPNKDGRNDGWTIENKDDPCLLGFKAVVFDRWGREVFLTNNPAFSWNAETTTGGDYSSGTYYHIIEYRYGELNKSYSGYFQLLR